MNIFKVNGKFNLGDLIISLLITLGGGYVIGKFTFAWSIIFFHFKLYGLAFIELIILLIFIVITTIKFLKFDKIAGILMIPYIIWVSFAGVLNFFVWLLNEM